MVNISAEYYARPSCTHVVPVGSRRDFPRAPLILRLIIDCPAAPRARLCPPQSSWCLPRVQPHFDSLACFAYLIYSHHHLLLSVAKKCEIKLTSGHDTVAYSHRSRRPFISGKPPGTRRVQCAVSSTWGVSTPGLRIRSKRWGPPQSLLVTCAAHT